MAVERKGLKRSPAHSEIIQNKGGRQRNHTDTGAAVQPHILLAVQRKARTAWREGRCPQMELSHQFPFTDGANHSYFIFPCPIAA